MKAILLIDHGSRRQEANDMLVHMAKLVEGLAKGEVIVCPAHMELADPSIPQGFAECVRRGADEIIAVPYMLSPGKHSTQDIPRMVAEAAAEHPTVQYRVTPALGLEEKLAAVVLERAKGNDWAYDLSQ
jgi:sirohydrochlorin ferrochelatase